MTSRIPEGQLEPRPEAVDRALERHAHPSRHAPLAPAQLEAFAQLRSFLAAHPGPWVLDAACGTGVSSHRLARRTGLPVVGIDRSAARLERGQRAVQLEACSSSPLLCLRADMPAIWRQLAYAGLIADTCYLLYPNPSPKPSQMGRRWYAHPCFRDLLASCARLELRTNWFVYAAELAHALDRLLDGTHEVERLELREDPLSPFEAKYHQSGHPLYRVRAGPVKEARTLRSLLPLVDHD